jgi:membrane protein implicated in regulation of membrane protease activity
LSMDQIVIALLAFACTVLLPFLAWALLLIAILVFASAGLVPLWAIAAAYAPAVLIALLALAHAAHRLHKAKSSGHEDKIGRVN